jgi:hypothetical protein
MQITNIGKGAALLWVSAISAGGIFAGARSASSWLLLAVVAIVPPIAFMGRMKAPKTTSESIGEVLR